MEPREKQSSSFVTPLDMAKKDVMYITKLLTTKFIEVKHPRIVYIATSPPFRPNF